MWPGEWVITSGSGVEVAASRDMTPQARNIGIGKSQIPAGQITLSGECWSGRLFFQLPAADFTRFKRLHGSAALMPISPMGPLMVVMVEPF